VKTYRKCFQSVFLKTEKPEKSTWEQNKAEYASPEGEFYRA
jgi:hypothetical protein